jgi:CheY-like chemotaxis protein
MALAVASAPEARERLEESDFDAVLVDLALPGGSGLDLLRQLLQDGTEPGAAAQAAAYSVSPARPT